MLDVIITERIGDKNLSLIYFETIKGYEVQYSDDDKILDTDGFYDRKKDGLQVYNIWLKELKMIKVICSKTGLTFKFKTQKQKERFFDLWDKYEVVKE